MPGGARAATARWARKPLQDKQKTVNKQVEWRVAEVLEHPDHRPNLLYRKTGSAMSDGTQCALETRYAGCRFRSRIEARWAVFFAALAAYTAARSARFEHGERG